MTSSAASRATQRAAPFALIGLALVVMSARPTPAPEASPQAPPAVRAGYEKVASEILCYCGCARQTVRDCTCGVAFDLREEFEKRLAAGESAQALIDEYLAEHGEQARNVPPKRGINLIAWFGPAAGIVVAAIFVLWTLAVWAKRGRTAPAFAAAGHSEAGGRAGPESAADDSSPAMTSDGSVEGPPPHAGAPGPSDRNGSGTDASKDADIRRRLEKELREFDE